MVQKLKSRDSQPSFAPPGKGKILVGLTGIFGAGKSTVGHMLEELGASVIDADRLAHEALLEGSPVYPAVVNLFPQACGSAGFDHKKIAEIIFREPQKRKALEAIIHPFVYQRMAEEAALAEEKIVIFEIPLLFETGFDIFLDFKITVTVPEKICRERLLQKGFSDAEIEARLAAQFSQQEKEKRSDFVVNNSGTLDQTRHEVEKIWKKLQPVSKGEK